MRSVMLWMTGMALLAPACRPDDSWVFNELVEIREQANLLTGDFSIDAAVHTQGAPPRISGQASSQPRLVWLSIPTFFAQGQPFEIRFRFDSQAGPRVHQVALWIEQADTHLRLPLTPDTDGLAVVTGTLRARDDRTMNLNAVVVPLDAEGKSGRGIVFPVSIQKFPDGPNLTGIHFTDSRSVEAIAFRGQDEEREVVSAGDDGTVVVWRHRDGRVRLRLAGHQGRVRSLAVTPDETRIVSAGQDGSVRIWDAADGAELHTHEEHQDFVTAVATDPAGSLLVSASWDHSLIVRQLPDGQPQRTIDAGDRVNAVAFCADGSRLAAGLGLLAREGSVRVWDTSSWETVVTHTRLDGEVHALAFSPDDVYLAATYGRGRIRTWSLASGDQIQNLPPEEFQFTTIKDLAYHPHKADYLVSGALGGRLDVWDMSDGSPFMSIALANPIKSIAFSPDGGMLALGDTQGTTHTVALPISEFIGF